jgi:hypothetical protein
LVFFTEWLNQHERIVYECIDDSCLYSIDVFCEGMNKNILDEASEKMQLHGEWHVVFREVKASSNITVEAEYLYNNAKGILQLINIKVKSSRKLELLEIVDLKKRLCEEVTINNNLTF